MVTLITKTNPVHAQAGAVIWCADCGTKVAFEDSYTVKKDGHAVAYLCERDAQRRIQNLTAK